MEQIQNQTTTEAVENPNLLAFENGILNKLTGEFMPHSERYFITSFINAEYRTEAQSTPHFDKWLGG